jgi:hypothetical protein
MLTSSGFYVRTTRDFNRLPPRFSRGVPAARLAAAAAAPGGGDGGDYPRGR